MADEVVGAIGFDNPLRGVRAAAVDHHAVGRHDPAASSAATSAITNAARKSLCRRRGGSAPRSRIPRVAQPTLEQSPIVTVQRDTSSTLTPNCINVDDRPRKVVDTRGEAICCDTDVVIGDGSVRAARDGTRAGFGASAGLGVVCVMYGAAFDGSATVSKIPSTLAAPSQTTIAPPSQRRRAVGAMCAIVRGGGRGRTRNAPSTGPSNKPGPMHLGTHEQPRPPGKSTSSDWKIVQVGRVFLEAFAACLVGRHRGQLGEAGEHVQVGDDPAIGAFGDGGEPTDILAEEGDDFIRFTVIETVEHEDREVGAYGRHGLGLQASRRYLPLSCPAFCSMICTSVS